MTIRKTLYSFLEICFLLTLAIVFLVSVTGTSHNIVWYKELFITGIILTGIIFFLAILKKFKLWIEREEKKILIVFYCLWGILLYLFSCACRGTLTHDYLSVYEAAIQYAQGIEIEWLYLARWGNNFPVFLAISILAKVSYWLGMEAPFYLILLVNVLMVLWTGRCIYILAGKLSDNVIVRLIGLILFVAFVPCWGGTHIFYSDSFSLCFGVWGLCFILDSKDEIWRGLCAGIVWAIGYSMKATSAIVVIAFYVILVISGKWRNYKKTLIAVLFGLIITILASQLIQQQFPSYKMEEYRAPIAYWIALGLNGNGSYAENESFAQSCLGTSGYIERKEMAVEYILKNREKFWDLSHLISKARYNFASGEMGLSGNNSDESRIMYQFFNDYGKYGGYTAMITSGYLYALQILGIYGALEAMKSLLKGRKESLLVYITQLTVFGMLLFLMIWEANNRQLYNHMPWFALLGTSGCYFLLCRKGKNNGTIM